MVAYAREAICERTQELNVSFDPDGTDISFCIISQPRKLSGAGLLSLGPFLLRLVFASGAALVVLLAAADRPGPVLLAYSQILC